MANAASRIDASEQSRATMVLPEPEFVPPPTSKRVVDAQELAAWYKKFHASQVEWVKKANAILQRTG